MAKITLHRRNNLAARLSRRHQTTTDNETFVSSPYNSNAVRTRRANTTAVCNTRISCSDKIYSEAAHFRFHSSGSSCVSLCLDIGNKKHRIPAAQPFAKQNSRTKPQCTSNVRSSFFTQRVINVWNDLPTKIVNFSSLVCFRRSLLNINFSDYLVVI